MPQDAVLEEHRPRLRGVAYRMLGSIADAEDAVQEAWIRLSRSDVEVVQNLGAWLTAVVGRVGLNMLRARKVRRESSLDVFAPDPVVDAPDAFDPENGALIADSVGLALLVVLESVSPQHICSPSPPGRAYGTTDRLEPRPADPLHRHRTGLTQ